MFVGRVAELPIGLWVGVKYDEPVGKNDGSVKGVRYFECLDKYGGFVRPDTCRSIGDFPECPAATPSAVSQTAAPPPPPASKASSLLATPASRCEPGAAGAATPTSRTRDPSTSIPRPPSTTRSATATTRSATSTFNAGEVEGGGTGVYLICYNTVPNLLLTQETAGGVRSSHSSLAPTNSSNASYRAVSKESSTSSISSSSSKVYIYSIYLYFLTWHIYIHIRRYRRLRRRASPPPPRQTLLLHISIYLFYDYVHLPINLSI